MAPAPEPAASSLGAVEVFSCDFEEGIDLNYDRWPDGWTRRRDVDHPSYLPVMIVEDEATGEGSLRIELDGGAAVVYSTPINVSDAFSYVLDASLRTEDLEFNVAYYSLTFYTADRVPRQTFYSRQLTTADDWTEVEIGPVHPEHDDVELAVIGLPPAAHRRLRPARGRPVR